MSVDLQVRPVHHRLAERVRAHIFICMLAYHMRWHLERAWAPLLFKDEDKSVSADVVAPAQRSASALAKASTQRLADGSPVHSFRSLLADLATLTKNTVRVPDAARTLGPSVLTAFVGALEHFKSQQRLEAVIQSTVAADDGVRIDLWDLGRIGPMLEQMHREWAIDKPIAVLLKSGAYFTIASRGATQLVIGAIPARELVRLPGITDHRLFAQNVRLGLGRTRVTQDIAAAVKNSADHPDFLSFHNDLTVVCRELSVRTGRLRMNHYSVCNGCQSLITLFENRDSLTDELDLVVRVVRVEEGPELAEELAYRTNNQNPISLRDLIANDATQLQLEADFNRRYAAYATYQIKRGTPGGLTALPNETAGLLLLSLYNQLPWNAHQKYRVFDDLYT